MKPLDILNLQLSGLKEKLNNLDDNSIKDIELKEDLLSNAVMFYFFQGGKDKTMVLEDLHKAVDECAEVFLKV
jgi:hypothetical protein